jgi:hypothetical protein
MTREDYLRSIGAWPVLLRIAREHRVLPEAILGDSRYTEVSRAREHFVFVLHGSTGAAKRELDRMLGYGWGTTQDMIKRAEARTKREMGF